ncbi:hypothetical protein PC116_g31016 [Phytophthora cactorum]|nr:hypothetical protein PC116_g31016 [Phytophthora cactorum]
MGLRAMTSTGSGQEMSFYGSGIGAQKKSKALPMLESKESLVN